MVQRKAIWLEVQAGRHTCLSSFCAELVVINSTKVMVHYQVRSATFIIYFFGLNLLWLCHNNMSLVIVQNYNFTGRQISSSKEYCVWGRGFERLA